MRKLTLLSAFLLSAAFAASPKVVVLSHYMDGRDCVVQVRNDSQTAITAIMVGTSETQFATTDMILGARDGRLLTPGETDDFRVPGNRDSEPQVLAVVFEDGATDGAPEPVNRLLLPRRLVYHELPIGLALLRNDNVNKVPASMVAGWFRSWRVRWQNEDPKAEVRLFSAAETYLNHAGSEIGTRPAHELLQIFEELYQKIGTSLPQL